MLIGVREPTNAVISKCGVDSRNAMISKLIKYVVEPYVTKDGLIKGIIEVDPLIEAAMRGWHSSAWYASC